MDPSNGIASTFITRNGFHFVLSSHIDRTIVENTVSQEDSCNLIWSISLPSALYLDPHELALFTPYNFTLSSYSNPELPAHAVETAPLEVSIVIESSDSERNEVNDLKLDVPIHARYALPLTSQEEESYGVSVELPCPTIRRVCNGDGADNIHFRLPAVFQPNGTLAEVITIPIVNTNVTKLVELTTMSVIFCAFIYLASVLTHVNNSKNEIMKMKKRRD